MNMNKILKFFPLMPQKGNTGKLVLAIVLYLIVPPIASSIVGAILGVTVILLPLAPIVGLACTIYIACGIAFAIFNYLGKEIDLEIKK